jgi:hypothetical protein
VGRAEDGCLPDVPAALAEIGPHRRAHRPRPHRRALGGRVVHPLMRPPELQDGVQAIAVPGGDLGVLERGAEEPAARAISLPSSK